VKRAHLTGQIQEKKWQALVIRANEVSAFDLDDIDDSGDLIIEEDDEVEPVKSAAPRSRLNVRRNRKR
jgi:hypothetical protein